MFSFVTHFESFSSTGSRKLRQQFRLVVDEDGNDKFRLERLKANKKATISFYISMLYLSGVRTLQL